MFKHFQVWLYLAEKYTIMFRFLFLMKKIIILKNFIVYQKKRLWWFLNAFSPFTDMSRIFRQLVATGDGTWVFGTVHGRSGQTRGISDETISIHIADFPFPNISVPMHVCLHILAAHEQSKAFHSAFQVDTVLVSIHVPCWILSTAFKACSILSVGFNPCQSLIFHMRMCFAAAVFFGWTTSRAGVPLHVEWERSPVTFLFLSDNRKTTAITKTQKTNP